MLDLSRAGRYKRRVTGLLHKLHSHRRERQHEAQSRQDCVRCCRCHGAAGARWRRAQTPPPLPCAEGTLPSGAKSLICVPPVGWNQQLVVFAPGYCGPGTAARLPRPDARWSQPPRAGPEPGVCVRDHELPPERTGDSRGRRRYPRARHRLHRKSRPAAAHVHDWWIRGWTGRSAAARTVPGMFSSGLAACGPVGSFRGQVNYVGDFRVLFDYFFPESSRDRPSTFRPTSRRTGRRRICQRRCRR